MVATLVAVGQLFRAMGRAIADPATRGLVALTAVILAGGTFFYRSAEEWSLLDAFYFSVVTLTTIGFGDLVPTGDGAKLFTIAYSLLGVGVVASLAIFTRNEWEARHSHRKHPRGRDAPDQAEPPA